MGDTVNLHRIVNCDVCASMTPPKVRTARYDARTWTGSWGYLCRSHFMTETSTRLGTGFGQKIIYSKE